jgi:hypothetical protein
LSEYEITYLFVDGIAEGLRPGAKREPVLAAWGFTIEGRRLFVEERRRLKIIPNAFGERAVLKLMFGALIRAAERWRSIKVTEFEHRQITAVRKELDQEYEAQVGLKTQLSKDAAPVKISRNLGLDLAFHTGLKRRVAESRLVEEGLALRGCCFSSALPIRSNSNAC